MTDERLAEIKKMFAPDGGTMRGRARLAGRELIAEVEWLRKVEKGWAENWGAKLDGLDKLRKEELARLRKIEVAANAWSDAGGTCNGKCREGVCVECRLEESLR